MANVKNNVAAIVELTTAQLENVLFGVIGVTFVGMETTTVPDMLKGGRSNDNHMFGKVVKDSVIATMMGFDYENRRNTLASKQWVADAIEAATAAGIDVETINSAIAHLTEYSKQSIEKFVAKERQWGKHMINPHTGKVSRIMVDHTKSKNGQPIPETYKRYVQVEIMSAKTPVYRYKDTGKILSDKDLETVKQYLCRRQDDNLIIRDYSIENVRMIRINKSQYLIVG